ncbi:putative phosphatidylinositol 3-kinase tor2 protein [Neofusicoccum parvum UCRNP2]|uniref:Serine/threonine-protein kinase TOR n=1 Tax=Botryosphaeria parva (strain UCR-NP2) TaxID=1287680 RepID=R1EN25_BOTPV|nr:putative phosphatidylinositol 3-kinase tor2 protein [Neofusicoccum parvum UCRNP2]
MATASPETVDRLFNELKSRNADVRENAAKALRQSLEAAHRELPPGQFANYYDRVCNRINALVVQGNETNERLGGIQALDQLIDFKGDDAGQKTTRFASYLRAISQGNDNAAIDAASHALGRLAKPGGTLTAELVEAEVKSALEWLQMDRQENRRFAAVSNLRELAKNSPTLMYQWVPQIFEVIWYALRDPKVRIRQAAAEAISSCLEIISARDQQMRNHFFGKVMLSIAVEQALSKHVDSLLDPMFSCGLSDPLTQCLVDMAHYVPSSRAAIQERLLDLLSQVLCGRPFIGMGSPQHHNAPPPQIWTRDHKPPEIIRQKEGEIALALKTLGEFNFSGHVLNEFVRDVAIKYVEADNREIRKAAALTACQLFIGDPIVTQTSQHAIQVVGDVIEKLLTCGVADVDPDIRHTVLRALDYRFDRHLGKAENVRSLFLALNDEVFEIREAAISIIGRLTSVNPAYVFPSLRKVLVQLLTEIEYSNSARDKEQSARLISNLVGASPKLIKPYVDPMITVLLPKARDSNPEVASSTLKAIGDLATVGGEDMRQYINELMDIIIENLQDLSSESKRMAALIALSQLASNAGYVIEPYKEHSELLTILINIVRTEPANTLRKETVKLMGVLGALDPNEYQKIVEKSPEHNLQAEAQAVTDVSLIMSGITPSNEEFYPTVVINTLMGLLKDTSLAQYHSAVVDAVMNIYATMGLKCVPFLPQVVPGFLGVIRGAPAGRVEGYFNQLSQLVRIVRQHIRPFLPSILETVQEFWSGGIQLQATILSLIEAIARSLEGEFKIYLANVLPLMLGVLDQDTSVKRLPSERVLHAFLIFGSSAEEYMHLIIPVIVRMFDKPGQPHGLRKSAIETIGRLSRQVNISEFAAMIIHPLSRVLAGSDIALKQTALDTLSALIFQLGPDYIHFIPTINKILITHKVPHSNYALIVSKLQRGEPLPQDLSPDERYGDDDEDLNATEISTKKLAVNQQHLKNAWDATQKTTREDWIEWMRRFSVELLRESPQQALRACTPLASVYNPIAKSLFNSAFVSCWTELYDQYQEELVRSIEIALASPNIPPEILQILLNLAEFMEHDDKALPIDVRTLGMYAARCHAYAKALHYKELEFNAEQNARAVEALISINNQLQQTDAAFGILRKAQNYQDVELKETWFEKLEKWEEALKSYQRRERDEPDSFEITMGKMKCLHALGEWDVLSTLAQDKWIHAPQEYRRSIAPLAAAAAWGLGQWELMDQYLSVMKSSSPDWSFFGAILAIHRNQFEEAQKHIAKTRDGLDTQLSAVFGESYQRAYVPLVRAQMLAELEEIITYKQNSNNPEKQASMRATWTKRLLGCQPNPEIWQRMLKVRALVISPRDNLHMWIKFTNLCRKNQRVGLAEKSLRSLLGGTHEDIFGYVRNHAHEIPHPISYAVFKFMWSSDRNEEALDLLKDFTARVADDLQIRSKDAMGQNGTMPNGINGHHGVNGVHGGFNSLVNGMSGLTMNGSGMVNGTSQNPGAAQFDLAETQKLLAKCYLKQGEWQTHLHHGDWAHEHVHEILSAYAAATRYNQNWYKAWHAWALANFEVVNAMTPQADRSTPDLPPSAVHEHIVPAIHGFFKSISLSSTSSLQDTLRLLTLWFAHGGHSEVNTAVTEGVGTVSIDTWLEVIPQLLARINQPNVRVRQSIHNLLLVDQADLVSHELIRIAVLWHEQWHEGLEEASRLYFGDRNIEGMFATLAPLHAMLDKGPETLREISFIQSFGRELQEARDWCQTFRNSGEEGDLNQAWDLYYQVFRKIARQLPSLMTLELQYVSPKLKAVHDLDLAVPGTYQSGKPIIRIQSFDPVSTVIQSKQRPRRLQIKGSDGVNYMYALKGHEDIRQDERVMQLFGLVNTLLEHDAESRKRHLNIQGYPAIPLSTQSGLLGWVPNSDTLHVLIREYRESRKILLNIEHRIMLQMAPDYDCLTLMQKVEVFGYALDNTTGQDLYRVLWLKSKSSEAWLDRRTNYTRSLAVMSMVGYILGLGDRHPSNLMLDKVTGKIIHIDFGDCFEVAMHREKYPERVPFRLTRMLTYAMEVSNIEGSYRTTCEHVMRVLRSNKESVMAVLEAFIHDPLLNWRLGNRESPPEPSFTSQRRASIIGVDVAPGERPESSFRPRHRSSIAPPGAGGPNEPEAKEEQNARALQVLSRVKQKLTGRDFKPQEELNVNAQVDRLIREATNLENLCQHYIGWCSFW